MLFGLLGSIARECPFKLQQIDSKGKLRLTPPDLFNQWLLCKQRKRPKKKLRLMIRQRRKAKLKARQRGPSQFRLKRFHQLSTKFS